MDESTLRILAVAFYILGVGAAVAWPYVNSRLKDPTLAFDWRYATWQLIGGIVVFFTSLLAAGTVPDFGEFIGSGWVGLLFAAVAGYGAARGGRELQRTNEARVYRKESS